MEATLVIKAKDLTTDYADGIMKVFSKNAILNITVQYDLEKRSNQESALASSSTSGKKRGRKPKISVE
ncbi:hypothetical protein EXU57_24395 [Segetibacter sp. 3557_3]|uniref:hypothetical protein n=1 Tax=Segetibacter sp. 3557_3 TaxID=2547429 RepID=UPI001058C516|nr:hypothetical protein [Segetibacter sp. 3557_3]TDH18064.1 hypothetical protein EXU57_24395 [Segetibacter sp. 3557_3]